MSNPSAQTAAVEAADITHVQACLDDLAVGPGSNLISTLQQIQDRLGYLPAPALAELSRRAKVPLSSVYGVVSFYAQFYTEPRGKHTVRCCRGTACHVRGGKSVRNAMESILGLEDGQTTEDMLFSFETVACLGACALAPVMVVDGVYHGKANAGRVHEILGRVIAAESQKSPAPTDGEGC